jgi:uncharacterized membrane protein YdfJ with MMPL/SSD domain
MFESWGRKVYRRRWLVLVLAGFAMVIAAFWGTGVFGVLQDSGGSNAPGSQSDRAAILATATFGRNSADVIVLYSSPRLTVASPAFRSAVTGTLAALPRGHVESLQTYWSTGSRAFVSVSGRQTFAVIELAGGDYRARVASYNAIKGRLSAPGLTTRAGGDIPGGVAINSQVNSDIRRAEAISLPVLLILLMVTFGSVVAASLPVTIGVIAILGSFSALRLLAQVTPVSSYSVNISTFLGLGLAIDYGLFMVGRFREESHRAESVEAALAATMATAGRTVAVSGVTVALALASLMFFPAVFLRSMGYGGVATAAVDMLAALTVLPALLAVLGPKVNALRVRGAVGRPPVAETSGGWYRLATAVMRRPLVFVAVTVAVLLVLGAPFLHVAWGKSSLKILPAGAEPRVVSEALSRDFPGQQGSPIEAVIQFPGQVAGSADHSARLAAYAGRLAKVPGVQAAQLTDVRGNVALLDFRYGADPMSPEARRIVRLVRAIAPPAGARVYIGGRSAELADTLTALAAVLPWMAMAMATATFVLLFLAFGSVVLPVKAITMNVVSLSAAFGVVTWIFQDGHLSGLLGFTPLGTIEPATPILMFAIIFGLSMDYEVFLLSRIRERYDVTGDNTAAVAGGLQRTGGVITSAALLLIIVVGTFSISGVTTIKLLGVGMIVALAVDATIVRVLLVPATMRLIGQANWWAPRFLRPLHARYGVHAHGSPEMGRSHEPVSPGISEMPG